MQSTAPRPVAPHLAQEAPNTCESSAPGGLSTVPTAANLKQRWDRNDEVRRYSLRLRRRLGPQTGCGEVNLSASLRSARARSRSTTTSASCFSTSTRPSHGTPHPNSSTCGDDRPAPLGTLNGKVPHPGRTPWSNSPRSTARGRPTAHDMSASSATTALASVSGSTVSTLGLPGLHHGMGGTSGGPGQRCQ